MFLALLALSGPVYCTSRTQEVFEHRAVGYLLTCPLTIQSLRSLGPVSMTIGSALEKWTECMQRWKPSHPGPSTAPDFEREHTVARPRPPLAACRLRYGA
ncbi:hypothetical protein P692DRAFT_20597769 [Suillus brevipes Sb2]|nr:hypothetical protein P692DRAFT_20151408 [Suillus brevipes Sb2]KAG2747356.1 hypothetical protein P692DRAFT_20597769 [Suillus brevipes Sb2]